MNSCKTVLEIMLTTRCQIVHTESRSLALSLLVPIMVSESSDPENSRSIEFESSCWIDGLTIECLPTFCKVLHDVSNNALNIIASVGRAWTKFKMSEAPDFSPLLMASLLVVDGSAEFSSFVAQVTARCLLFLRNPMPLAALIQYVSTKGDRINTTKTKAGIPLVDYSNVLLAFDGESGSKRFEQLGEMLRSCFAPGNQFLIAHSWLKKSKVKKTGKIGSWFEPPENFEKSLAFSKFLIHIVLVARGAEMVEDRGWALLRRAVPTMLLVRSW